MSNRTEPESLLSASAADLDIPDDLYEKAVVKYNEVGEWLGAEGSELYAYAPEIYPQGSFRLGTAIRPIRGNGEYDIDLVCLLKIEKDRVTQQDLKELVGRRLRLNKEYADALEACRRCWRLDVSKQFHLDILPSIPNVERPPSGILLTDRNLRFWQRGNPIGYGEWFASRMPALKEMVFKAAVEDIPEWKVRTPL